jgi:hypothetical protein
MLIAEKMIIAENPMSHPTINSVIIARAYPSKVSGICRENCASTMGNKTNEIAKLAPTRR